MPPARANRPRWISLLPHAETARLPAATTPTSQEVIHGSHPPGPSSIPALQLQQPCASVHPASSGAAVPKANTPGRKRRASQEQQQVRQPYMQPEQPMEQMQPPLPIQPGGQEIHLDAIAAASQAHALLARVRSGAMAGVSALAASSPFAAASAASRSVLPSATLPAGPSEGAAEGPAEGPAEGAAAQVSATLQRQPPPPLRTRAIHPWLQERLKAHGLSIMQAGTDACPLPQRLSVHAKDREHGITGNHPVSMLPGKSFVCEIGNCEGPRQPHLLSGSSSRTCGAGPEVSDQKQKEMQAKVSFTEGGPEHEMALQFARRWGIAMTGPQLPGTVKYNHHALGAAAYAGLLVDGNKMVEFLLDVSELLDEAIAAEDPTNPHRYLDRAPGGSRHIPYSKLSAHSSKMDRWRQIFRFLGRARREVGPTDLSSMMGESIALLLVPRQGVDPRKRAVRNATAFLEALLTGEKGDLVRVRLKQEIARIERPKDHVAQSVMRKRRSHASYDALDEYRDQFFIKLPSRGALTSEAKVRVAWLYVHAMAAGPTSTTDESVIEEARLVATQKLMSSAKANERKDNAWRAFCGQPGLCKRAMAEAQARGLRHSRGWDWMKVARVWFAQQAEAATADAAMADAEIVSVEAEATAEAANAEATEPANVEAAADAANVEEVAAGAPPMAAGAPPMAAGAPPMDVSAAEPAAAGLEPVAPEPMNGAAEPPHSPEDADAGDHFDLGGLIFAEVRDVKKPCQNKQRGARTAKHKQQKTSESAAAPPVKDKVRAAFILEILKTSYFSTRAHGCFGPAAFYAVIERAADAEEVHLIVKVYENELQRAAKVRWAKTERAYDLYKRLGFEAIEGPHQHACMHQNYSTLQEYMWVSAEALRAKLKAMGPLALTGDAAWVERPVCRLPPAKGTDAREWFEPLAIDAINTQHAIENQGDGTGAKDLVNKRDRYNVCISLFAAVPKWRPPSPSRTASAVQPPPEEPEEAPIDDEGQEAYAHVTIEQAGERVRVFEEDEPQTVTDGVECETATVGPVAPSWGAMLMSEAGAYLVRGRLRGQVFLLKSSSCVIGWKVTLDAAVVRRAKRGHKHWTTIILQLLCTGIRGVNWGWDAVRNQMQNAQSPNTFVKLRVWNDKDNASNFEAHVVPVLKQLLEIEEKGMTANDMISVWPPCNISLSTDTEFGQVPRIYVLAKPPQPRYVRERPDAKDDSPQEEIVQPQAVGMQWHSPTWRDSPDSTTSTHVPTGGFTTWADWLAASRGGATAREVMLDVVTLWPKLNVTLDGGTWLAAAGVRATGDRPSIFGGQTKDEHMRPFEWVWLEQGDSVCAYCARVAPGNEAFFELAKWAVLLGSSHPAARAQATRELDGLTREPDRKPLADIAQEVAEEEKAAEDAQPPPPMGIFAQHEDARQRLALEADAADKRRRELQAPGAEVLTSWADARTRKLCNESNQLAWLKGYVSPLDGRELEGPRAAVDGRTPSSAMGRYGLEEPLREPTFVRVPVPPDRMGSRELPKAVWGELPVLLHACLCILHAGMRTAENWLTAVLGPLLERLEESAVESVFDEILNPALKKIGLNDIRINKDTKKAYPISFDGTAVERILKDLEAFAEWGASGLRDVECNFLTAVADVYDKLGAGWATSQQRTVDALPMIRHWTIGMRLAFRMKPQPEDYALVKQHLALYVVEKRRWGARTSWYDDEALYNLGNMHEKWGSLRLVSQEGSTAAAAQTLPRNMPALTVSAIDFFVLLAVEAWQKKLNEVLRLSNGFANAGAIPMQVKREGERAEQEYKQKRSADRPSQPQWIYEQAALDQHAYFSDVFAVVEALKQRKEVTTQALLSRAWRRFMVAARFRCRLRARWLRGATRRQKARSVPAPAGADYYSRLLVEYYEYKRPVDLTADNLSAGERRRQEEVGWRMRWEGLNVDGVSVYSESGAWDIPSMMRL